MDAIDNRYVLLDKLGEGGMGSVHRARDRLTGQLVALKRVHLTAPPGSLAETLAADAPEPQPYSLDRGEAAEPWAAALRTPVLVTAVDDVTPRLLALAQEFRTLASIHHPHIISVLDYGFDARQEPFFTMELLEGGRPLLDAAPGLSIAQRIRLLLQVLEALTYVHRRGVLHRDLKPANVLVVGDGDGAHVKVLDFGIALARGQADHGELAGTVAYMAPELFGGRAPSEASDLWAMGVMAHEMLLGAHPIQGKDTFGMMRALVGSAPIFSGGERLDPQLTAVLRRALARSPGDRHADAAAFAEDLARAAGLAPPAETAEIRESFLQAASFVAREEELATLRRALDEAMVGRGSVWLVGGESGVGKSRLLDELRTQALVRGTRVVRGQAVSAGGVAYQAWQAALRPLCLDAQLGDLEAGVLRAALPDLAALLDRPVPDPPELDPQSAQARFILTALDLVLSPRAPLLLLLEDLHWADPASLALLQRLPRRVAGRPLLVVGSYRDDERPDLPDALPGARSLPLRRLSAEEMESLAASMLGEAGRRREVVNLLERETEGNAFFIVEVLRALAQEVGALARIGAGSIPSRVVAGGVQAVLARRLGRVPDGARPLLSAAAVLGRELDAGVLRALGGALGARVDADLAACAAASVLEVIEDRWRFAHDKLREAVLAGMADGERAAWHLRIGEAIEHAYAGDLAAHAAALAYHLDQGHDLARAARYQLAAGESATRAGAMLDAIAHLERAVELLDRVGGAPLGRARALGLLAQAYHGAGRPEECTLILERMIADVGAPAPRSMPGLVADIARRAATHARFRLWPEAQPAAADPAWIACTGETLDSCMTTCEILPWTRSPARILHLSLSYVVLAERLRDPARLGPAYAAVAFGLATTPLAGLVDGYLRSARSRIAECADAPPAARAFVKMIETIVHESRGEWETARACLDEDIELHVRRGDWRSQLIALLQGGALELHRGDLGAALDFLGRLDELASRVDSAHFLSSARCIRSVVALRGGDLAGAARLLVEAREHQRRSGNLVADSFVLGASALCALRRGDAGEARRLADAALERMPRRPPFMVSLIDGPPAVVEVYAALLSSASSASRAGERSELRRRLDRSLAALRTLGEVLPIARSRSALWDGICAVRRGQAALGARHLHRALDAARRYRVPFDEALARAALADVAEARGEDGRAAEHRRSARAIFERLGASWHVVELDAKARRGGAQEMPVGAR